MGLYENPFKMENREYPLDFEFPKSNRITVNYTLPEGYRVESVPENVVLGLPNGLGSFKYTIRASGNQLQFSSTTDINAAIVPATYYQALKEFFNQIVTKQSENVVLTKA